MRTTMHLAPDVREILRHEGKRRGTTMTSLLENAVRLTYRPKKGVSPQRRLVRENGYLVVAALPDERPVSDAKVKEILQEMAW